MAGANFPHHFFGGFGMGYPSTPFEQNYRCYSASFIDKPHLENGDKVIMPPSALDRLASLHIEYPMLFEIHNPATSNTSHCGVLEFVADEGMIIMPYWMMQNLLLQEGDIVRLRSATLPKGTYVKLQPHTKDFLDISNPKAVLETTLRSFSCLTVGDNIMVAYNNKKYYIDIVESKPANAISIIETDCEVDFAPPLDYKEPERVVAPPPAASTAQTEAMETEEPPKFLSFTGTGRRIDGKPSTSPAVNPTPVKAAAAAPAPAPASQRASGKLVFGSQNGSAMAPTPRNQQQQPQQQPLKQQQQPKQQQPQPAKEEPAKEEPKFQAFSGKKYTLR